MSSARDEVMEKIAGSVVVSPSPGSALKTWRQRLGIRQISLANEMHVSPSVLSDYESGRRSSPGVGFVKRYVEALVKLDRGSRRLLERLIETKNRSAVLAIGEFRKPTHAKNILELLEGEALTGEDLADSPIYGYTVLDSIKTIYALSGFDFYQIFGATTERVLIFTKVGMGRSPLVAIRVSQLKPRMVVLHGPKIVDPLAVELAKKENIILARSGLPSEHSFSQILEKI